MPKMIFTCSGCGMELEVKVPARDTRRDVVCPECGTILVRPQRRTDTY